MAERIHSHSSSTSGSCKPTEASKGVPVIGMFSNTYWKRKDRGFSGLAELTVPPQERAETSTGGTFGKSCSPSFYIAPGIVLSVLCCPPKEGGVCRRDLQQIDSTGKGAISFMNLLLPVPCT